MLTRRSRNLTRWALFIITFTLTVYGTAHWTYGTALACGGVFLIVVWVALTVWLGLDTREFGRD